ncbi:MAG TPA: hypothetical protein VFZ37_07695 [Jiangellaceae bacterium]
MARAMFSVSVVDGSGTEVYGEPVTASFELADGSRREVTRIVGSDGQAHFAEELAEEMHSVTFSAARECVGPIRPGGGAGLVIEA